MFKEKTALILGAGASCAYDYPTGGQLIGKMDEVCNEWARSDTDGNKALYGQRLGNLLRFYDPVSIDSFLSHYADKPDIVAWAKMCIGQVLISTAKLSAFEKGHKSQNWYRLLWNAIVSEAEVKDLSDPKIPLNLNIITFNYDVSLEAFLYSRVTNEDSIFPTQKAQDAFLAKLSDSIHHVYGRVMTPIWCGGNDENWVYEIKHEHQRGGYIQRCKEGILLISDRENEHNYEVIQDRISEASQVIFLGFGFDDINIGERVLNLRNTLAPRYGTQGLYWSPLIKYTNYENHEIINRKVVAMMANLPERKGGLIKSDKRVFDAISQDFTLNTYH